MKPFKFRYVFFRSETPVYFSVLIIYRVLLNQEAVINFSFVRVGVFFLPFFLKNLYFISYPKLTLLNLLNADTKTCTK